MSQTPAVVAAALLSASALAHHSPAPFDMRLSLTADRRQVQYTFTIEDPVQLTQPISYTAIWDHRADLEPLLEVCDPANVRRSFVQ
jgi:hypothetical protein